MKTIAVFGATGGLGSKLIPLLKENYEVLAISSKIVDVTNLKQVQHFFEVNDVDIVLNLSGKKFDVFLNDINEDNYQSIIDMLNVNIMGNINILAACLPRMIEKKSGKIIAISSVFSEQNIPKNSIYCASKAFLDRLISTANKENAKYGITCNTIQLGYTEYGMGEKVDEKFIEMAKNKIGLKRFCTVEELFKTIVFLIENDYVCGSNLKIDGGI